MSLSECAERTRLEFYRLLPHFVRLPSWENITIDLPPAGYADRAVRLWALVARTNQSDLSGTPEESVKAALAGLELVRDASLLARDAAIQTAPRVELIDGMILSALDEEDRELYRQPRAAAEYLVRLAGELGVSAEPNHPRTEEAPIMSTERPKKPTFAEQMEKYIPEEERELWRKLNDPATVAEEMARLRPKPGRKRKKGGLDDVPSGE